MAVEILLKARDGNTWKRGDVVSIYPSPHQWGPAEAPPTFWVVIVEGVNIDDPRLELLEEIGDVAADPGDDPANPLRRSRKKRFLNDVVLPAAIRDALNAGPVTVTAAQANTFFNATTVR